MVAAALLSGSVSAQVYSPLVLLKGQSDTTSLPALAQSVFQQSSARSPRERAEAIWRFFLTDGRFVEPGMIYHIAGWAYEEPGGEVLDPLKLLNSYGFGLCYHIAPLLESVFEAGGFADARVWFLTGHTVAEVFYDGGYHYFDSDMMGYSPLGTYGPIKQRPVASVHQIELDGSILTGKLVGSGQNDVANVDTPWYPADVRAHAIGDLAKLFTTIQDNWLFPEQRFSAGHTMDFVLRPGERITRYFQPEQANLKYLPYRFDGTEWREFPQELEQYKIKTADGPRSQKDARRWATGVQQFRPAPQASAVMIYPMPCPYVIIDANVTMTVGLPGPEDRVTVETSADGGRTWIQSGTIAGPYQGSWVAPAAVLTKSEHGSRNAVSGTYGYSARVSRTGGTLRELSLTTRFQVNPRTLPKLIAGNNTLEYNSSHTDRWAIPVSAANLLRSASRVDNASPVVSDGQTYIANIGKEPGGIVVELKAPDGGDLSGFDAGARFLDLHTGFAPDKVTAEIRKIAPWPLPSEPQSASLSWSTSVEGPYQTIWAYDAQLAWKDNQPIDRVLRWPEVDRQVRQLPKGTRSIFVRYRFRGLGMDSPRLAAIRSGLASRSPLLITHVWSENGKRHERVERISANEASKQYTIPIAPGTAARNEALILETLPEKD